MKAQRDPASRFKITLVAFILLVILVILSICSVLSVNLATVVIPSSGTLSSSSGYITIPSSSMFASGSGTSSASVIQTAINTAISYAGAHDVNVTVYIPAGDWECDQTVNGIYIDLETLPAGCWLNIIGSYNNVTTTQQNGLSITCPATILRSYTVVNAGTTSNTYTFEIVGSVWGGSSDNNYVHSANRHIRISGITILGYVTDDSAAGSYGNDGIDLNYADGFLIDHCFLDSNTEYDIGSYMGKGVISNCNLTQMYQITNPGAWGYGVAVAGNSELWQSGFGTPTWIMNLSQVIGKYDWQGINITYSNPQSGTFTATGSTTSISFTAGPVYIENSYFYWCRHAVTGTQYGYYVLRYCTINSVPNNGYIDIHGVGYPSGRGLEAYDNLLMPYYGAQGFTFRGGGGVIYNNTFNGIPTCIDLELDGYSSGDPNDPMYINDLWIWGNTFNNCGTILEVEYPTVTVAGVKYFTDSLGGSVTHTNPAPPRPNYTPYTYPHPLTLGK